jgi:S-adenosylmethionine hydrolase
MGFGWISLTTDYGLSDGFVAACHGVIARSAPQVRVIDVTHLVPPADVRHGAAVLAQTVPYLPPAVHVAVVDPGVGTGRRGIAVAAPGGLLVGPDNGLLLPAAEALGGVRAAVELTNPEWLAPAVSRTFHGRDVFAPVAARLAGGAPLADAGPPVDPAGLVRLPTPVCAVTPTGFTVEVLTVDHFGNVQLAAPGPVLDGRPARLRIGRPGAVPDTVHPPEHDTAHGTRHDTAHAPGHDAVPDAGYEAVRGRTFGDAAPGGLVVYVDSAGQVAVAVNGGRAADRLGVRPGDRVSVRHPD